MKNFIMLLTEYNINLCNRASYDDDLMQQIRWSVIYTALGIIKAPYGGFAGTAMWHLEDDTNLLAATAVSATVFGIVVINYANTPYTGPILMNGPTAATITKWQLNVANPLGATTSTSASALDDTIIPPATVMIISGTN